MWKPDYTILPEYSPLYSTVPYHYKNYHRISAICRGHQEVIQKFLPQSFEYVSDVFEVFILNNETIEGLAPYAEGGLVIPCRYKEHVGAYMAFEYVNTDEALCAGREIWGYPKKLAQVTYEEREDGTIRGTIVRKGKTIIDLTFEQGDQEVHPPQLFPRLQIKRMPRADRYGTDMDQVILNEFYDTAIHQRQTGKATVNWEYSSFDPLAELGPVEVLGGIFTVGDFSLTYGKVIDEIEPKDRDQHE